MWHSPLFTAGAERPRRDEGCSGPMEDEGGPGAGVFGRDGDSAQLANSLQRTVGDTTAPVFLVVCVRFEIGWEAAGAQ